MEHRNDHCLVYTVPTHGRTLTVVPTVFHRAGPTLNGLCTMPGCAKMLSWTQLSTRIIFNKPLHYLFDFDKVLASTVSNCVVNWKNNSRSTFDVLFDPFLSHFAQNILLLVRTSYEVWVFNSSWLSSRLIWFTFQSTFFAESISQRAHYYFILKHKVNSYVDSQWTESPWNYSESGN